MADEQLQRISDLLNAPWRKYSEAARVRVPNFSPAEAEKYFRPHENSPMKRDEIELRSAFDNALCEFQLLELAVECGYLSLDVVRPVAETDFDSLLKSKAAIDYLRTYDFVTVRFLAARLGRDLGLPAVTPPPVNAHASIRFATFISLHADFTENEAVDHFTKLLDDFRFAHRIDAEFLKEQLAMPKEVYELSSEGYQAFMKVALGLLEFVQILSEIFLQLSSSEKPLFGCFYSYWLSHFFGERRDQGAYRPHGVTFENVSFHPALRPTGDSLPSPEQLQSSIAVLREVWEQTKVCLDEPAKSSE